MVPRRQIAEVNGEQTASHSGIYTRLNILLRTQTVMNIQPTDPFQRLTVGMSLCKKRARVHMCTFTTR